MRLCPSCGKDLDRTAQRISFEHYVVLVCDECGLSFGVPTKLVCKPSFNNYQWTETYTRNYSLYVNLAKYSLSKKLQVITTIGTSIRSMLDVGCGNGAFVAAAENMGIYAEGIDIDMESIHFAQSKGLRVRHCDIFEYTTPNKYDFIHIKGTFHLVDESKEFIRRVAELLRPGGVLYIDSTHQDGLASRFRRIVVKAPRYGQLYPPVHNRAYNKRSLAYVLERAAFEIAKYVTFSRGNPVYFPTIGISFRQYAINPILDTIHLGGFVGCYAIRSGPT